MHHVTPNDTEDLESHVSVGQISHVSQQSVPDNSVDEEVLPTINAKNKKIKSPRKDTNKQPVFRYTYGKDTTRNSSQEQLDDDVISSNQPGLSPRTIVNQSGLKTVILPRLANFEPKSTCTSPYKLTDQEQLKFPEIKTIAHSNATLALNRSITDLLDPEMEILNKIKHMPRRRRRKRRQKMINPNSTFGMKSETD